MSALRKPAQTRLQAIRTLTVAAARKGAQVRTEGRDVVVEDRGTRRAFSEPDQAAAYLLVRGAL